jgi:hypothetical protein
MEYEEKLVALAAKATSVAFPGERGKLSTAEKWISRSIYRLRRRDMVLWHSLTWRQQHTFSSSHQFPNELKRRRI